MTIQRGAEGYWDNTGYARCEDPDCGWFVVLAADFRGASVLSRKAEEHDAQHPDHAIRNVLRVVLPEPARVYIEDIGNTPVTWEDLATLLALPQTESAT